MTCKQYTTVTCAQLQQVTALIEAQRRKAAIAEALTVVRDKLAQALADNQRVPVTPYSRGLGVASLWR